MKVAITGTIGSGKSTVLKMLADEGYPCLSADAINKELLEDGVFIPRVEDSMLRGSM